MAASKQNIKAGSAYIEIAEKGIGVVQKKLDALGASLKSMGESMKTGGTRLMAWSGAALGGMFAAIKSFAETGAALDDMANRTGASAEALSLLGYAAEQAGTSIDTLETVLKKTNKAAAAAAMDPKSDQANLFRMMGINIQAFFKMKPEERILALAEAMRRLPPAMQEFAAVSLFKSTEALPFLTQGAAEIAKQMQAAKDKGLGWSEKDIKTAAMLDDAFVDMWRSIKMVGMAIGEALAPEMKKFIDWLVPVAKSIAEWIRANKGLVVSAAKLMVVVFAAGAALFALGAASILLGGVFSGLSWIIGATWAVLKGGVGIIGSLFKGIWGLIKLIPLLVSKTALISIGIGLVIAAFATLIGWVIKSSIAFGNLRLRLSTFGEVWKEIKDMFRSSWEGIVAAVMSGDLASAMEIAWVTLKITWMKGINFLKEKWIAFKYGFVTIMYAAFYEVQRVAADMWTKLKSGLSDITTIFKMGWSEAANYVTTYWTKAIYSLARLMVKWQGWFKVLTPEQEKEQLKILDDMQKNDEKNARKKHADDLKRIQQEGKADQARIEQEKRDWDISINKKEMDEERKRRAAADEEIKKLEDEEAAAKKKLDELVKKAKKGWEEAGRSKYENEKKALAGGDEEFDFASSMAAASKTSSAGTFSAWGVRGMGGNIEGHLITQVGLLRMIAANTKNKPIEIVPVFV